MAGVLSLGAEVSLFGDLVGTDENQATEARPNDTGQYEESSVGTRSFLIRIWKEVENQPGSYFWRGRITEVRQTQRKYVKSLDEVGLFFAGQLRELGIKLGWKWRSKLWLQELKQRLRIAK